MIWQQWHQLLRMSISTLDIFLLMQDGSSTNTHTRDMGDRCFKMKDWPLPPLVTVVHHVSRLSSSMCFDVWSGSTCLRPRYGSIWKLLLTLMTPLTSAEITSPATSILNISQIRPQSSHKYSLHTLFSQNNWRFDWLPSPWPPLNISRKNNMKTDVAVLHLDLFKQLVGTESTAASQNNFLFPFFSSDWREISPAYEYPTIKDISLRKLTSSLISNWNSQHRV